jgi:hypothetical protein
MVERMLAFAEQVTPKISRLFIDSAYSGIREKAQRSPKQPAFNAEFPPRKQVAPGY